MNIADEGALYQISHVTGPTHNCLRISFLDDGDADRPLPLIECLPSIGDFKHLSLNPEALQREALAGIAEANLRFGTNFRVKQLQYVDNDMPPEAIYRYPTLKLVEYSTQVNIP